VEPIVKKPNARYTRYTDDIKSTYIVSNIYTVYGRLKKDYVALLEYRESKGSPFNPKKTEV